MNADKLKKLESSVRTGGKGSVRRKRKAVHKGPRLDDKQIQSTLQRLSVSEIPRIEEVNLFKNDGNVIHFTNPRVQAQVAANTYVISGSAETKSLGEMLTKDPEILTQMGAANVDSLKKIAESLKSSTKGAMGEEDDDMPELEGDFEQAAKTEEPAEGSKVETVD